jgi:hypothetical protein
MLRAEGRSWDVARHRRVEVRSEERARRDYSYLSLLLVIQCPWIMSSMTASRVEEGCPMLGLLLTPMAQESHSPCN